MYVGLRPALRAKLAKLRRLYYSCPHWARGGARRGEASGVAKGKGRNTTVNQHTTSSQREYTVPAARRRGEREAIP